MSPDSSEDSDKLDEVAAGLDDLTTAVEELEDDPPADLEPRTIHKLSRALEHATDAADELEDQEE